MSVSLISPTYVFVSFLFVTLMLVRCISLTPDYGIPFYAECGATVTPERGVLLTPKRGIPMTPKHVAPLTPGRGGSSSSERGVALIPEHCVSFLHKLVFHAHLDCALHCNLGFAFLWRLGMVLH